MAAVDAQRVAERMARDSDAERERQVDQASRKTVEHEGLRAAAEQKAAEQSAAATHALALREAEFQRAEKLAAANKELAAENKKLEKELAGLREQLATATTTVAALEREKTRFTRAAPPAVASLLTRRRAPRARAVRGRALPACA
ncbi:hypothetical protein ACOZ38_28730 [Sphaerisporangium viridialbum]|uniref:hypothetical protein n=1 Tax=Sphaerisporangium viridialbum TaxID=46189 RepID=UPI003C750A7C